MKGYVHQVTVKVVTFKLDNCPYCGQDLGKESTRTAARRRYANHVRLCDYNPSRMRCGSCAEGVMKYPDKPFQKYSPILCKVHDNGKTGLGISPANQCKEWHPREDGEA